MIYLFTDFGYQGPYVGELKVTLSNTLDSPYEVIDLIHDAPMFDPESSAYLLAALSTRFKPGDACLAVVDPGVGDSERRPILVKADGVTYCGPDNGLFSQVIKRTSDCNVNEITWRPDNLSTSFHGRDLFAPALAASLNSQNLALNSLDGKNLVGHSWPRDLDRVIYIDGFGNLVTGRRANTMTKTDNIRIVNQKIEHAETFSSREKGQPFWYSNSMGLVEIAVNQLRADDYFDVKMGTKLSVIT